MFEVYFSYDPRQITLVDWDNLLDDKFMEKRYATLIYGKYTDWKWVVDFYPNPLANVTNSQENVMELADMEDAIKKLFEQDL